MTISRKYTFQPGQTIQSAQVNEEFNQLVDETNKRYTKEEADATFIKKGGLQAVKPTLANGWTHRTEGAVAFFKTQEGLVFVTGGCAGGAVGRLNLVCYIPDGFLPDRVIYQEVNGSGLAGVASGLLKFQDNRIDIERDLPDDEIFFNAVYRVRS